MQSCYCPLISNRTGSLDTSPSVVTLFMICSSHPLLSFSETTSPYIFEKREERTILRLALSYSSCQDIPLVQCSRSVYLSVRRGLNGHGSMEESLASMSLFVEKSFSAIASLKLICSFSYRVREGAEWRFGS